MVQTNNLNVMLVEQNKTRKWLAESLEESKSTVFCGGTNVSQPSVDCIGFECGGDGLIHCQLLSNPYRMAMC